MPLRLHRYYFLIACLVIVPASLFCQQADHDLWLSLFNKPFDSINISTKVLWDSIATAPKAQIVKIIQSLEADKAIGGTDIGQAKLALLKMRYCRQNNGYYEGEFWRDLGNKAQTLASIKEDDYVLQSCCNILGDIYLKDDKSDTAIFYLLKSAAMAEQLGYQKERVVNDKVSASNALYHTQNYEQCILFCSGVNGIEEKLAPITVITAYNNIGLSYLKLDKPDSAIYYFSKAADYCRKIKWGVWEGIVSGNIGDVLHTIGKDAAAMPYWQMDYDSCIKYREYGNAGLTLAYMSQYQFNNGLQQQAINQLHWCENTNKNDAGNLLKIYAIKAYCYRKLGLHDSADYFLQQHYYLNDSINRVVSRNNFNTVQLKFAFEKNMHEYQLLKKQRQAELLSRNYLIGILLASLLVGLLLYNRQRLKVKLSQQQKEIAEAEKNSAQDQLSIFTQTLLEKNEQIENLHLTLQQQQQATNDELIHQTLLTDYDWNRFKELFEKIHPLFFAHLKQAAPGITPSEMRLAALIKLNLDNKQMASMQGISVSSLRGNKTRLRQKLNIPADTDVDELIKQL